MSKHLGELPEYHDAAADKANIPLSEVKSEELHSWVDSQKEWVKTVEVDIRDAKRRVNLAKGPKKQKEAAAPKSQPEGSGDDEDEQASAGSDSD